MEGTLLKQLTLLKKRFLCGVGTPDSMNVLPSEGCLGGIINSSLRGHNIERQFCRL